MNALLNIFYLVEYIIWVVASGVIRMFTWFLARITFRQLNQLCIKQVSATQSLVRGEPCRIFVIICVCCDLYNYSVRWCGKVDSYFISGVFHKSVGVLVRALHKWERWQPARHTNIRYMCSLLTAHCSLLTTHCLCLYI